LGGLLTKKPFITDKADCPVRRTMTYRGQVKNGVIVPESGVDLPEGTEVRIHIEKSSNATEKADVAERSMYERYKNIIGVIKDLPPDASERVDEYLYGSTNQ
jgi:predicted DNA-binding antitoxin AbrB/MazE fold protein